MGMASSKVSSVARTFQAMRPHIPAIKFPNRESTVNKEIKFVPTALSVSSQNPTVSTYTAKSIGSTPRGTGMEYNELPSKYHRRLITQEEMEYIEKGGPV